MLGEMFRCEQSRCGTADTIVRPTTLNQVHTMKIGELRTCSTSLEPSHGTKSMVSGDFLVDLTANLVFVMDNFGTNGQNTVIVFASIALKCIIISLEWK